jgi:diguanylate cyclase (GGDEF)-like protein
MFKKKILVIDDSDLMLNIIRDIIESAGYEAVTASSGKEGLDLVRKEKPDLVLLDVIMPEMNGFEVCEILRNDDSNNLLPIIILTAKSKDEDKLRGLELGADDYIIKPFNPRELISRVNNTLRRIDKNRYANPLTGLQGNTEIMNEINHRIANNEVFAVIYLDMDNFKAYNDVYGFAKGDTAIKMTADLISDNVKLYGDSEDFIGHIGGDDFVLVTTPEKAEILCREIIEDFDRKILTLYNEEDRNKGYITTVDRRNNVMRYPIMTISAAIVTNEKRVITSHLEVAEIAAELKKKAKCVKGSVYIKDRREK